MQIKEREKIKLGMFFTLCCHNDLEIVTTETDIDSMFKLGIYRYDFWNSKLEALEEIKTWFENGRVASSNRSKDLKEIELMIEVEQ